MAGLGVSTQVQTLLKPAEPALAEQYFQQVACLLNNLHSSSVPVIGGRPYPRRVCRCDFHMLCAAADPTPWGRPRKCAVHLTGRAEACSLSRCLLFAIFLELRASYSILKCVLCAV